MKLVLVHGINQQDRVPEELQSSWLDWLSSGMPDSNVLQKATVDMPFYGKVLFDLMHGRNTLNVIEQGEASSVDAEELAFIAEAMGEAGMAAGLSAQAIAMEQHAADGGPVEQGFLMNRRVNAIARLLERISPAHGRLVLPLVSQAYAYLRRPGIALAVDQIVGHALDPQVPTVVVAHSLGTVVTFKLMRALAQAGRPMKCPLYVTLGSPLALRAVSAALGVPFVVPPGVDMWVNAVDPSDAVTLGKPLDASTFADHIENIMDLQNVSANSSHDVEGYLKERRVAAKVEMALR